MEQQFPCDLTIRVGEPKQNARKGAVYPFMFQFNEGFEIFAKKIERIWQKHVEKGDHNGESSYYRRFLIKTHYFRSC